MIYPKFLKKNGTIGICAPSAGVGKNLNDYLESIKVINDNGYKVFETKSVRVDNKRSASKTVRAKEFHELLDNDKVDMIFFAAGGDYMMEMLPYVDFNKIKDNPKLMCGMSDPTNLLYPITTNCDIATLYGFNAKEFSLKNTRYQKTCFDYIKGNITKQKSYKKYITCIDYYSGISKMNKDVKWVSKEDVKISGRCIGGCFEVIDKLMGTSLDKTKEFIEKYKDDGIVWYFDVYSENSYQFYLTLMQFKMAGYFKYCKGVLFGRVAFPHIEDETMDYHKAADLVLGKIPHIMEMDIGHTDPKMMMINGAIINVECKDGKGSISFELK